MGPLSRRSMALSSMAPRRWPSIGNYEQPSALFRGGTEKGGCRSAGGDRPEGPTPGVPQSASFRRRGLPAPRTCEPSSRFHQRQGGPPFAGRTPGLDSAPPADRRARGMRNIQRGRWPQPNRKSEIPRSKSETNSKSKTQEQKPPLPAKPQSWATSSTPFCPPFSLLPPFLLFSFSPTFLCFAGRTFFPSLRSPSARVTV